MSLPKLSKRELGHACVMKSIHGMVKNIILIKLHYTLL